MTELYIEGQRMDTGPDTVIARTFQQNLLSSQGSIDSPYTNSFSLPYTKNNSKALGQPEETTSLTDTPYVKLDCLIRQDGIEQFPNSIAEVQGFEGNAYNVQVFGGAVPFFDLLGDKNLNELNLSQYTHTWDYTNVVSGGVEGVYVYDLIDRGKPLNLAGLHPSFLYPSVYAKAIWHRICLEANVGYTMAPHADFENLLLPFCNEKPVHNQAWIDANTNTYALTINGGKTNRTVPVLRQGVLKAKIVVTLTSMSGTVSAYFELWKSGVAVPFTTKSSDFTTLGQHEFEVSYDIEAGADLNGLELRANLSDQSLVAFAFSSCALEVTYGEDAFFGTEWDLAANLPDMKQKDFVLALCKLFGWSLVYEPYAGVLLVKPLNDVTANLSIAKDWTGKIDYTSRPKVAFKLPETARNNRYKWAEDETVPAGLGDGVIHDSNEHLEEERDAVELPFAASEQRVGLLYVPLFTRSNPILETPHSQTVATIAARNALSVGSGTVVLVEDATGDATVAHGPAVYTWYNEGGYTGWIKEEQAEYDTEGIEPRLALLTDTTRTFTIKQGNSSQQVTRKVASFLPLHFEVLLPKYHSITINALSRVQLVTMNVRLTAQDFAELDSTVPVWVERFKDYYYLNKVTDYVSASLPCEAELIKLN